MVVHDADEAANTATHGVGFILSLAASGYLMSVACHRTESVFVACVVYSATLILLYAASTLSHAITQAEWRQRWRTMDQSFIFLLIAGSYTPYAVVSLSTGAWWILLVAMWTLAVVGVIRVLRLGELPPSNRFAYGMLGLLPTIALSEVSRTSPEGVVFWIILGGAFYLTGTIFFSLSQRVRFSHATWHTFVVAGSVCHFVGILKILSVT